MRAVIQREWNGPEALELVDLEPPRPAPTEVLVRVGYAGVNPVDHYTAQGLAYNRMLSLPFRQGWDVAGVVTEIGYGVTRFRPGDRVFGMPWFPREAGAYAEYVTAPSRHFARMPAELSFAEAAALPLAGLTAWQMLEVAQVAPGQRVLVTAAAGGVGHLAVQIAKARGAHVIGTARAAKHEFLRQMGVDEAVDYTTRQVSDVVRNADAVIQMFGGEPGLKALECLRPDGILVSAQGAWTPGLAGRAAQLGVRALTYLVEPDTEGLESLADLVRRGQLRLHVANELPLERAAEAHHLIATGRTTGKVVLHVADLGA